MARLEVPALRKALNQYRALTGAIIAALEIRSSVDLRSGVENYLAIACQQCLSLDGLRPGNGNLRTVTPCSESRPTSRRIYEGEWRHSVAESSVIHNEK